MVRPAPIMRAHQKHAFASTESGADFDKSDHLPLFLVRKHQHHIGVGSLPRAHFPMPGPVVCGRLLTGVVELGIRPLRGDRHAGGT